MFDGLNCGSANTAVAAMKANASQDEACKELSVIPPTEEATLGIHTLGVGYVHT